MEQNLGYQAVLWNIIEQSMKKIFREYEVFAYCTYQYDKKDQADKIKVDKIKKPTKYKQFLFFCKDINKSNQK